MFNDGTNIAGRGQIFVANEHLKRSIVHSLCNSNHKYYHTRVMIAALWLHSMLHYKAHFRGWRLSFKKKIYTKNSQPLRGDVFSFVFFFVRQLLMLKAYFAIVFLMFLKKGDVFANKCLSGNYNILSFMATIKFHSVFFNILHNLYNTFENLNSWSFEVDIY